MSSKNHESFQEISQLHQHIKDQSIDFQAKNRFFNEEVVELNEEVEELRTKKEKYEKIRENGSKKEDDLRNSLNELRDIINDGKKRKSERIKKPFKV